MKTLYAVGCSFAYGDELQNPETSAWPVLLGKKLGMNVLNDSEPGGSNQRTCYRLLKNFGAADLYVISWTNYARFTFYDSTTNYEVNFTPGLEHSTHGHQWYYRDWGDTLYRYWYNELYAFKLWLQQIIYTQSLLRNVPYIMINAANNQLKKWCAPKEKFICSVRDLTNFDAMDDQKFIDEHYEIQHYIKQIDTKNFYQWGNFNLGDLKTQFKYGPRGHLLEDGQVHVAKLLHNFYVQNQNSNC